MIQLALPKKVVRFNLKKALLYSFVALGPLGNLLTPHFFPDSFRTYYFFLPLFPLFALTVQEKILKIALLCLPFFLFSFLSASIVEISGTANEPFPLFRFFLLFCQFFFVLGAVSALKAQEEIYDLIKTYLKCYFLSLFIGYIFFFGYYLAIVPLWFIERFSILTQFGFALLRFSPGSYPNEYGILSSYVLSLLTMSLMDRADQSPFFPKRWARVLFLPTFLALLLTTTRAAYLSYFVCFFYLNIQSGRFFRNALYLSLFFVLIAGLLIFCQIPILEIFRIGFSQKIDEGSLGERYFAWQEASAQAQESPIWGTGFASLTNIHNVYLQLLFELGFVGCAILLGSLIINLIENYFKYPRPDVDPYFKKLQKLGLINVLSFAASNHNLNHHLTWFVFFLCLVSLRFRYLEEKSPLPI